MMGIGRASGFLLAVLLSAMLARAHSLGARKPQESDDDDETTSLHFYTPTPVSVIPTWYTSTATASQSAASVSFAFGEIQDTTVCGESSFIWSYYGSTDDVMVIAAKPVEVDETSPSDTMITILNGGLGISSYTWSPVTVPEGEYALEVVIPNASLTFYSDNFIVSDSSDHSCLNSATSQASGTASSTSASGSASESSSSADGVSSIPVVGATSDSSSMSSGCIAGIVIGVLIFVGAVIAAIFIVRRYRANRAMGAPRGGLFEKRRPKGAVSISSRGGSFSSHNGGPARGLGSTFATAPHYNLNDPSGSAIGHDASDEDLRSPSIIGEKPLTHAPSELGMIPPVVHRAPHAYRDSLGSILSGTTAVPSPGAVTHHYNKHSRHSSLFYTSDPFRSSPPTPSPRPSGDYQRQSAGQSHFPVALYSPSSADSTPRLAGSPGVPRDVSLASSSMPDLGYDADLASPSAAQAGGSATPRRAAPAPPASPPVRPSRRTKSASARKPVPTYEPSVSGEALELVEPSTPHSTSFTGAGASYYNTSTGQNSHTSLAPSSTGNDWSSGAVHSHSPASASSGSYLSHASGQSLPGFVGMPELNHKSSFGDRQMHVIMPDPPPQEMQ